MLRYLFVSLAFTALTPVAQAGFVTVERTNTDNIEVPTFDQSLGTLLGVQIEVTLLDGQGVVSPLFDDGVVSAVGSHRGSTFASSLFVSSTSVTVSSTFDPLFADSAYLTYSGGGIDLGAFVLTFAELPSHSYTALFSITGHTSGTFSYPIATAHTPLRVSGPRDYAGQSKTLSFSGSELALFLGSGDVSILAGSSSTSFIDHRDVYPEFILTATYSNGLQTPWTFRPIESNISIGTFDPRFNTKTTFIYSEPASAVVPEPTSLALAGVGGLVMAVRALRRRRLETVSLL